MVIRDNSAYIPIPNILIEGLSILKHTRHITYKLHRGISVGFPTGQGLIENAAIVEHVGHIYGTCARILANVPIIDRTIVKCIGLAKHILKIGHVTYIPITQVGRVERISIIKGLLHVSYRTSIPGA